MIKGILKKPSIIFALLTLPLLLASCSSSNNGGGMEGMEGMDNSSPMNSPSPSAFTADEIMFAQMMIPHHQQAVTISKLALTNSTNPEILALAKTIMGAQEPEIVQMKKWLDLSSAPTEMEAEMGMGGMLSDEDMANLAKLSGKAFDRAFLLGMIEHHLGAIEMTEMIDTSDNSEVKTLSEDIVRSQSAEILEMKQLLAKLG